MGIIKYQFTEDCRIGIVHIDQEHETLFAMINEAFNLLEEKEIVGAHINSIIQDLRNYANTHFAHEEAYMEEIGDPELERQKGEHEAFREAVNAVDVETITGENGREKLTDLLLFLSKWLYGHILRSDIMIGHFGEREEDPFAFTDKYKTGIRIVDKEHAQLFAIIRKTDEVLHAELLHDRYDEIVSILQSLKDYTVMHFADEEAYMEKIGYEGLEAQKKAHQNFVDHLNEINLFDLDETQDAYLEDLIEFLLGWLTNHILKMDKKIPKL